MGKEMQKRIIYILMVAGLVWIYVSYVPFLLDYYLLRPEMGFSEFYHMHILEEIFEFEGILIALMIGFLYCLTWDVGVSVGIMSLALFLLTHGSYVKYQNRNELLRLADLQLTEAAGMAAGYLKFCLDRHLIVFVLGMILFVAAAVGVEIVRKKFLLVKTDRKKALCWTVKVVSACLFAVAIYNYTTQFVIARTSLENVDNNNLVREDNDRFVLYRFVKNDSLDAIDVENVAESYDYLLAGDNEVEVQTAGVKPNVIVIMNESWWNTDNIDSDKIEFSRDPMGPYKRLYKRCITGHLTSNVYGGGTISSEAEFLTGINTKYYVTSSTIYEETMDRKLPSLVDYFNALDYETIAIHPFYGDFYSRDEVYETMQFDEVIFEEDMKNREVYTRYISDDSLADEIIAEYEEQGDEKNKFIWSVSVANHKKTLEYYLDEIEDYDYPITAQLNGVELEEEDLDDLLNAVNGIYKAGQAYTKLVNYFSQKKEPVVIVMFGDHVPNFSADVLDVLELKREVATERFAFSQEELDKMTLTEEELLIADDIEMLERLYSVPVVMWSNFDLEEKQLNSLPKKNQKI